MLLKCTHFYMEQQSWGMVDSSLLHLTLELL